MKNSFPDKDLLEEQYSSRVFHSYTNKGDELFLRISLLSKLKRVVAYCLRFKEYPESRTVRPLTLVELERAMTSLISTQRHDFTNKI